MDLGESKQVVNVNKNLKEWMNDPNNVYIERRGIVFIDGKRFPEQDSPYANPFKVGKDGTRDEVFLKRNLIWLRLKKNWPVKL